MMLVGYIEIYPTVKRAQMVVEAIVMELWFLQMCTF